MSGHKGLAVLPGNRRGRPKRRDKISAVQPWQVKEIRAGGYSGGSFIVASVNETARALKQTPQQVVAHWLAGSPRRRRMMLAAIHQGIIPARWLPFAPEGSAT